MTRQRQHHPEDVAALERQLERRLSEQMGGASVRIIAKEMPTAIAEAQERRGLVLVPEKEPTDGTQEQVGP